jgi:hypothetical protein
MQKKLAEWTAEIDELHGQHEPDYEADITGEPESLSNDDIDDFLAAAEDRINETPKYKPPPSVPLAELKSFIDYCYAHNPVRVQRMRSDLRWMKKMAKRYGIKPSDVRWLL